MFKHFGVFAIVRTKYDEKNKIVMNKNRKYSSKPFHAFKDNILVKLIWMKTSHNIYLTFSEVVLNLI